MKANSWSLPKGGLLLLEPQTFVLAISIIYQGQHGRYDTAPFPVQLGFMSPLY